MSTAMTETPRESLQSLLGRILLVNLTVSWNFGNRKIAGAIVEVDGKTLTEENATPPQWRMIPRRWKDKFTSLEGRARRMVKAYGVPFCLEGMQMVPEHKAAELFERLEQIRTEFYRQADLFCEEFPSILESARTDLGEAAYNRMLAMFPSGHQVRNRFHMRWAVVPIRLDQDDNTRVYTDLAARELVQSAREQMADMIAESVDALIRQPREELAEAANNLADAIETDGRRLSQATVDVVRRAIVRFRDFNFDNDPQLLSRLLQLDRQLDQASQSGSVGQTLREAGGRLATALRQAGADAVDEAVIAQVRTAQRRLLL